MPLVGSNKMPEQVTEAHRLFIAVSIPDKVKSEIEKTQDILRRAMPIGAVRWTKPEQFHITLKFLGNVKVSDTDALTQAVRDVCKNFSPLKLRAEWLGFFPNENRPRVVWIGVHDKKNILLKLQKAIESAVKGLTKEAVDKAFTGHLTLGRAKDIERKNAETLRKVAGTFAKRFFGGWTASEVEIFRSDLSADGSHYHRLASVPLAAAPPPSDEDGATEQP
jgi:2'-5' RNA ligase